MPKSNSRNSGTNTVEQGVALVNAFWDASAQARVDHPEKGAERNAAFKSAHAVMAEGLTALGFSPKLASTLPASRKAAIVEVTARFTAALAAPVAEEAIAA